MAQKSNIRSIRFSDEIADLINRQVGETFTQKFENLVTRCAWELPQKEQQLRAIEERIKEKRKELREYQDKAYKIRQKALEAEAAAEHFYRVIEAAARYDS